MSRVACAQGSADQKAANRISVAIMLAKLSDTTTLCDEGKLSRWESRRNGLTEIPWPS